LKWIESESDAEKQLCILKKSNFIHAKTVIAQNLIFLISLQEPPQIRGTVVGF
jgi:hypothetical protein